MVIETFHSELPRSGFSLRCFNMDCQRPAVHLSIFELDGLPIRLCLCEDCFAMTPEVIIHRLMGLQNLLPRSKPA